VGPTGGLYLLLKWPGRETDHLPPSDAEVKNAWSDTHTPPYVLMAWFSVQDRDVPYKNTYIMYSTMDVKQALQLNAFVHVSCISCDNVVST